MDWSEVELVIEPYQDALEAALVQGERPMPVGLAITRTNEARYAIARNVGERHLSSVDDVRSFADAVRQRSRDCGAAGVVAMVPRQVADELLNRAYEVDLPEYVALCHMEHITKGVRTWVLEIPNLVPVGRWGLAHQGLRSGLPPFIDNRRYASGGTA